MFNSAYKWQLLSEGGSEGREREGRERVRDGGGSERERARDGQTDKEKREKNQLLHMTGCYLNANPTRSSPCLSSNKSSSSVYVSVKLHRLDRHVGPLKGPRCRG